MEKEREVDRTGRFSHSDTERATERTEIARESKGRRGRERGRGRKIDGKIVR